MAERERRVALVAGGGTGIGAATAARLASDGHRVVILDPGVSVEGRQSADDPAVATVAAIETAGGAVSLHRTSVTDPGAVEESVARVLDEFGGIDLVVDAAGFDRLTDYRDGAPEDWAAVLDVHIGGHVNLLLHSVPALAATGRGRFVGFTSGAGWRAGHGSAYGAAKRVLCELAWELGPLLPAEVALSMLSPIADTRMTRAHARDPVGVDPAAFPPAEHIAPLVTHVGMTRHRGWNGQVVFTDGSEVARVGQPRLLEAVALDRAAEVDGLLAGFLQPAEVAQRCGGGGSARSAAPVGASQPTSSRCAVVVGPGWTGLPPENFAAALEARGTAAVTVDGELAGVVPTERFTAADARLRAIEGAGPVDSVVVLTEAASTGDPASWETLLPDFAALPERLLTSAAWLRAAWLRTETGRPVRLVTVSRTAGAADRAAAQAVAQLGRGTTRREPGRFAVSAVTDRSGADSKGGAAAILAAALVAAPEPILAGGELVVGRGWIGVESHPAPETAATFGGPAVPPWLDAAFLGPLD